MKHKVKFENSNEVIAVHDYVGSLDMNLMNSDTYHWYLEYQEKNTFDLYSCRSWYRNDRDRLRILSRFLKAEKRYYNDEYIRDHSILAGCYIALEGILIGLKDIELTPDNIAWLGLMTMVASYPVVEAVKARKRRKDVDKDLEKLKKVQKEIFMKCAEKGRAKKLKKYKYTYE
ncbi:MAG: hypothetical protein IJI43_03855 [Bacilli bacterium]|nr:hypothetical protein [Bacilli bacterium]